jgi:hypothetical protein
LLLIVAVAFIIRILVANHAEFAGNPGFGTGLNGSRYWVWPWRTALPAAGRLVGLMLAAAAPLAIAHWMICRPTGAISPGQTRKKTRANPVLWKTGAVGLVVISSFALQMGAMAGGDGDGSLDRIGQIVHSEAATSYFNDAATLVHNHVSVRQWLGAYPTWLDASTGHNRNKPPGPTLYFRAWIELFGDGMSTAQAAGIGIATLAALTCAGTYLLVTALGFDAQTAIIAAIFWALCPGPVGLLPELDQIYGLFTCAIVGAWALGWRSDSSASGSRAVVFGATAGFFMALGLFTTYALLVLVFILAALTLGAAIYDGAPGRRRAILTASAGVVAFLLFYGLLWLACGFDPIATFIKIRVVQNQNLAALQRYWPGTIPWDLLDFTLCSGWLGCLLAVLFLIGGPQRWPSNKTGFIAGAMLVQILLIGLTGVLQSEVTRLWIFVLPLLAVPVGLELRRWNRQTRLAAFVCMWILLTTVVGNIRFILL